MTTTTVSNQTELLGALNRAQGGDTIVLENGHYGSMKITADFASTVTVRAENRLGATICRIVSVEVREGEAWAPLDPAKVYAVASNNFMRGGGDGYTALRDEGTNAYDYGPGLESVLADYLAARPGYEPYTDGRITMAE